MSGFFPDLAPDKNELPDRSKWEGGYAELIHGDCHEVLETLPSDSVALVLFSPPYDKLRVYDGSYTFDIMRLGGQIARILRPGGICVMVIQDQIVDGGRSLTSIRTTLNWCDEFGFKLFEMLIYSRHGAPGAQSHYRFRVDHEYMPVFLKGDKPAHFDPSHLTTPALTAGKVMASGAARRMADGKVKYSPGSVLIAPDTSRGTIWRYNVGNDMAAQENKMKFAHPATYPDRLAYDHILCWTEPGALVVDPFGGSGSTAVAAIAAGRCCISIDINKDYVELARRRCYPNT